MGNLHALLKTDKIDTDVTQSLVGDDGLPLNPHTLRVLLVVMMLQPREPRATLWPFPHPEATGDILEAMMG
eukprot:7023826-Pyramimonas_sp.AAC.1